MSRLRRKFGTIPWLGGVCLLLLVAVIIHSGGPEAYAARPVHSFTGEQLYRGLILGHGQVADLIPQVRDHYRVANFVSSVQELEVLVAAQDRIIASIDDMNPDFFQRFRKMIRSGDHLQISAAFEEARVATLEAIGSIPEVEELRARYSEDPSLRELVLTDLREMDPNAELTESQLQDAADAVLVGFIDAEQEVTSLAFVLVAAVLIVITVATALAYVSTINVAAAVNFYATVTATTSVYVTSSLTEPGTTSLLMEELVHSVAEKLAA